MFQVKIENLTPREILFYYLAYENKQPFVVVCEVMCIKKSMYYILKQSVDEEVEKQRRRYLLAQYQKKSCNSI